MDKVTWMHKLRQVLDAKSLQELTDLGRSLLGNPLFVSDMGQLILAYTRGVETSDTKWNDLVVNSRSNTPTTNEESNRVRMESRRQGRAELVLDPGTGQRQAVRVLTARGVPCGVLVLCGIMGPIDEEELAALELVAGKAEQLMVMEGNRKERLAAFLTQLLSDAAFSEDDIAAKLNVCQWKPEKQVYVILLQKKDRSEPKALLEKLAEQLCKREGDFAFIHFGGVICVRTVNKPCPKHDPVFDDLRELMQKHGLAVGVSQVHGSLRALSLAFSQAVKAMLLSAQVGIGGVSFYEAFGIYHLFELVSSRSDLRELCCAPILELEAYDLAHGGNLLETLYQYLLCGRSLLKTSETMFIHRNTVAYRIRKSRDIIGESFDEAIGDFTVLLSIHILIWLRRGGDGGPPPLP